MKNDIEVNSALLVECNRPNQALMLFAKERGAFVTHTERGLSFLIADTGANRSRLASMGWKG